MGLSCRFFTSICSVSDSEGGIFYIAFDLHYSVPRIPYYFFFFEKNLVVHAGCCYTKSRIRPCIREFLYKTDRYGIQVSTYIVKYIL